MYFSEEIYNTAILKYGAEMLEDIGVSEKDPDKVPRCMC
jgi:hypothetical protein